MVTLLKIVSYTPILSMGLGALRIVVVAPILGVAFIVIALVMNELRHAFYSSKRLNMAEGVEKGCLKQHTNSDQCDNTAKVWLGKLYERKNEKCSVSENVFLNVLYDQSNVEYKKELGVILKYFPDINQFHKKLSITSVLIISITILVFSVLRGVFELLSLGIINLPLDNYVDSWKEKKIRE